MMGTVSVAIGVAACIEGTLVNLASGGGEKLLLNLDIHLEHLKVGAVIKKKMENIVDKANNE